MACINGYTYDIFISYAHVDNIAFPGQTSGWIEQFYTNLNLLLAKRLGKMDTVKIWWDSKKLDGSIIFDDSIQEGIKRSAIMICLISPGYLASDYCKKELELFYKKAHKEIAGLKVNSRSRIFNVLLNNIPFTEWPRELNGTTGFSFHDAKEVEDFGDPLDTATPQFRNQLQDLRDAIVKLINDFLKVDISVAIKEDLKRKEKEKEEEDRFTIYIGEVADTLRTARRRTITELEKKGYKIVTGIPPPYEAELHAKKVKEELKKADLSVHLLDQYPGREMAGIQDMCYPQNQTELCLQTAKSKLIWVPAEVDLSLIEDEKYKRFLQGLEEGKQTSKSYEHIRGAKSTLTQEIADFAEQLKLQQQQLRQAAKGKIAVLLDTHFNDQAYAWDLGKTLLENEIQAFINPEEDDPRKNLHMLADRIRQVNKLIFLYGKVSKDWVLERISEALKTIITNNFPVDDFFIFLVPPHKEPNDISLKQKMLKVNVINNSDDTYISTDTLQQLLRNLKREAHELAE
jgi:hypothetical protein